MPEKPPESSAKPNILLVTTDQMRADHMGCAGNPVIRTPNLDRLAAGGVRFERAYCNNPTCMPNRASIVTGRLPKNHRTWSNGINLDESETTIAHILAAEGYRTAIVGKGHLSSAGGEPRPPFYDSLAAWRKGIVGPDWSGPYYGFEEAQLSLSHGDYEFHLGHYGAWLRENFPDAPSFTENARQSPIGAFQCWTPDMPLEAHASVWVADRVREYIGARASDGEPFLMWASFPDPHHPFCPPAPYDTMYDHGEVVMPRFGAEALDDKPDYYRRAYEGGEQWEGIMDYYDLKSITEPQMREIIARTYGMVTLMDENLGRILDALDETGLADNTIVIFTSDHGDLMGDCGLVFKGQFLLEGLIRVPMIWRVPGASPRASDALVNSSDIMPTLLDMLGIDIPRAVDGVSQRAVLEGAAAVREAAFVEMKSAYHPEMNLRTIVTGDRKLTHYAGLECGELYDLTADVPEARNLYCDKDYAADRAALEKELRDEEISGQDEITWPESHA